MESYGSNTNTKRQESKGQKRGRSEEHENAPLPAKDSTETNLLQQSELVQKLKRKVERLEEKVNFSPV